MGEMRFLLSVKTHYFDIEKCKVCPLRDGCYKEGAKSKSYSVSLKSETHAEQLAFQKRMNLSS